MAVSIKDFAHGNYHMLNVETCLDKFLKYCFETFKCSYNVGYVDKIAYLGFSAVH